MSDGPPSRHRVRHHGGRPSRAAAVAVAVLLLAGSAGLIGLVAAGGVDGSGPIAQAAPPRPRPIAAEPSTVPPAVRPSATARPAAAPLPRSAPVRVQVAAAGIDTDLVELGLTAEGTLEVPAEGFPAGWFTGAPTPGEIGPAVIVGHVDHGGAPAVFHRLRELVPGDQVGVTRADGVVVVFAVRRVQQVPKDAFPTEDVYGDIDHPGLRLITCGGSVDPSSGHYRDNIVVYAELVRGGPDRTAERTAHPGA